MGRIERIQATFMKEVHRINNDVNKTNQKIVVAGGRRTDHRELRSVEIFNWNDMTWSQLPMMNECRVGASSFRSGNEITVTGGNGNNGPVSSITRINISLNAFTNSRWFLLPTSLPGRLYGHRSMVCHKRLITVGGFDATVGKCTDNITQTFYDPPFPHRQLLARMSQPRCFHGAELINDDKIVILGGRKGTESFDTLDTVEVYDCTKGQFMNMAPLPHAVHEMATVPWGHNVVVLGGADKDGKVLNTVFIYNIHTGKALMLPEMKFKRKGCQAAAAGNAIVVIGGRDERGRCLDKAEYFTFDRYGWEDLPL